MKAGRSSAATAAANPPSRGPLAGDLTLLSGQRESHFSRVTRLSFEQLQKLVSDEWQRNNTDLLSPGEEDTGRTTAEIIQDEVKDPARCARCWPNSLASAPCWTAGLNTCRPGETRKTLLCRGPDDRSATADPR